MMNIAQRLTNISPSATLKLTSKAKEMKSKGLPVISFAAGEPDFDVPEAVKAEGIKSLNSGFTKYTPTSGIPELKEAICQKFAEDQGLKYSPEQVVVSCGAKHSLYNLIQVLCDPQDEVIIPAPYWVSYPEMVSLAGGKPVFVPTNQKNNFKINSQDLRKAITPKTKMVILNTPSNPTGGVLDEKALKAIAEIIIEKDLVCISDEIYEYYIYQGLKHYSIAALGEEIKKRTFVVNGTSKSHSMTGLRIGYMAGDAEVVKKIGILQDHSTSNPTSICQRMAVTALGLPKNYRQDVRTVFEKRSQTMMSLLTEIKGFKPFKPEGAFYAFCDIEDTGFTSEILCERLLDEAHVAIIPGKSFGSDKHIRFSFATSQNDIEEGLKRIKKWMEKNTQ